MFTHLKFPQLESFASPERLARYLRMAGNDQDKAAALYLQNLAACGRFYELTHWLEVGLRNAMNNALTQEYGLQWYDNPKLRLGQEEKAQIFTAKRRLTEQKKPQNNPDMVAAISFGFWANLFNSPYEDPLWRHTLRKTFAGHTGRLQRHMVAGKLKPLLHLRNRVAHYEPILELPLAQREQDMLHVIGWIDPAMCPPKD